MRDSDFDARRREIRRQGMRISLFVNLIIILAIVLLVAKFATAYRVGCLDAMLTNGVCTSDPTLDGALKNALGR